MQPTSAGKEMWLWAQTADQKLEQNAQIHDADGMQALFVLFMTELEAVSQQK